MRGFVGEHIEGIGQQTIAREDRHCIVEHAMQRGPPTSEIVIVHGRQIIMGERIAMQHLDSACDAHRSLRIPIAQGGALKNQHGPKPFAAAKNRIAHRLHEARRAGKLARADSIIEQRRKRHFHRLSMDGEQALEIGGMGRHVRSRTEGVRDRIARDTALYRAHETKAGLLWQGQRTKHRPKAFAFRPNPCISPAS